MVRLVSGPLCDRFGPRYVFAGCLLAGAIPTFLAGAVHNASGLLALRFFIGILGGSFVPCQVWSTGFFDTNVVGTANALTAGFGNSGGGITYFAMPHIFMALVGDGLKPHVAWRVAFVVPGILILVTAVAMLILCPDCPTGKWSERETAVQAYLGENPIMGKEVPSDGHVAGLKEGSDIEKSHDDEKHLPESDKIDVARGEVVQNPSIQEATKVIFSLPTLALGCAYFCSFGTELAVNSILGAYYTKNFKKMSLTDTGNWAAMFGLLNVVFRPLGGVVSDFLYSRTRSLWVKKGLIIAYGLIFGAVLIVIGQLNSHNHSTMFGLVALVAFFLEGENGLIFSLVPHVHPYANGIVSGLTGGCGNLGGIVFSIIFRYNGTDYGKVFWIIGVMVMGIHIAISWIRPAPKGYIGRH